MIAAIDFRSEYIKNFRQVSPALFAFAQPVIPEGIRELGKAYHLKTLIRLESGDDAEAERTAALDAGINLFVYAPLPGIELIHELPPAKVTEIMDVIENPANQPVGVHCLHGSDRTGAIVGCYRIDHGFTLKEAIDEMWHYGDSWVEFGMRDTVEDWMKRCVRRVGRGS